MIARALSFMIGVGLAGFLGVGELAAQPPTADTARADTTGVRADTLVTRADSIRARVLDRVRILSVPPEDDPPDSLRAPGDSIPGDRRADGRGQRAQTGPFGSFGTTGTTTVALPPDADSVMRALAALPGYTTAIFQGRRAEYSADRRELVLSAIPAPAEGEGGTPARFASEGVEVQADSSITFDEGAGLVRTSGRTVLVPDRGDPVRSRLLIYDVEQGRGTALGAQTTYSEGMGEWIVLADLTSVRDGEAFGTRARFTSDDRPEPNSHFEASEIKILSNDILVARSVRLHFSEVPVAWLPFLAQPLISGRRSGLLTPRFSVNDIVRTSGTYQRRISNLGMYWAMSDYSDMTIAGDWWSGQYMALTGSLRYRWARRFLQGEVSTRRFWREEGSRDFAVTTRNSWDPTERARVNVSGNFVSNTGLVRQNSFDPRELTSSINSQAGIQQRFGWGSVSMEARRQQYLTDDRVEMTLPSANVSVSTITLFSERPERARFYNNMTVNARSSLTRDMRQLPAPPPDRPFAFNQVDQIRTRASAGSTLSMGNLSLGLNANYRETVFESVPDVLARPREPLPIIQPGDDLDVLDRPRVDYSDADIAWTASLSWMQRIFGATSITPSLNLGGQLIRVDSIAEARNFIEGPTRLSFGVGAQTELYGFYRGFAGFDAIRHKLTPSASYSYAPAVNPTALQRRVFGAGELRVQNAIQFGVNQTFEARVREPEGEADPAEPVEPMEPVDPDDPTFEDPDDPDVLVEPGREEPGAEIDDVEPELRLPGDGIPAGGDPVPGATELARSSILDEGDLRRPPPSRVITLLSLNTQALMYDLVRADSTGFWLDGFTTPSIRNTVRSDFLRGLDLSFTHDLWNDPRFGEEGIRTFSPHLSQMALGFSIDNRSGFVRSIARLFGIETDTPSSTTPPSRAAPSSEAQARTDDPFGDLDEGFNDDRVIPGLSGGGSRRGGMGSFRRDGWTARLNYSLRRPREGAPGIRAQTINGTMSFQPADLLSVSWTTAYDLETRSFSDHMVTVMRDMYDWEASFGFRQAVNGNWTFRFEVSLKANRDLRFDHETRNMDPTLGGGGPFGPGGSF